MFAVQRLAVLSKMLAAMLLLAQALPAQAGGDAGSAASLENRMAMSVADRVMHAIDLLGTPYRKRGTTPESGFDCSGFIGYVFRAANAIELPRSAREMYANLRDAVSSREALEPGDLLFFNIGRGNKIDHVGLYLGENRFVHAPASGGSVRIDALDLSYWQQRYAGARRVPSGVAAQTHGGKPALMLPADTEPVSMPGLAEKIE